MTRSQPQNCAHQEHISCPVLQYIRCTCMYCHYMPLQGKRLGTCHSPAAVGHFIRKSAHKVCNHAASLQHHAPSICLFCYDVLKPVLSWVQAAAGGPPEAAENYASNVQEEPACPFLANRKQLDKSVASHETDSPVSDTLVHTLKFFCVPRLARRQESAFSASSTK